MKRDWCRQAIIPDPLKLRLIIPLISPSLWLLWRRLGLCKYRILRCEPWSATWPSLAHHFINLTTIGIFHLFNTYSHLTTVANDLGILARASSWAYKRLLSGSWCCLLLMLSQVLVESNSRGTKNDLWWIDLFKSLQLVETASVAEACSCKLWLWMLLSLVNYNVTVEIIILTTLFHLLI